MLTNGLGDVIREAVVSANRFVDLFTGSGAVAVHVATKYEIPVVAADLQAFSVALAGSIIERVQPFDPEPVFSRWVERAEVLAARTTRQPQFELLDAEVVARARRLCGRAQAGTIARAYGGHYFSPVQARWIDGLRRTLPRRPDHRRVAIAALVEAASRCAASPGHTAQPFQPTGTAIKFLNEAWGRDIVAVARSSFDAIAGASANRLGSAKLGSCNEIAAELKRGDVAFIDPPYSGVHYSRFYHVLESIVSYEIGEVSGRGRYPDQSLRPVSDFSIKSRSVYAFADLLATIRRRRATAIVTFPEHVCSNGLSGNLVKEIAARYFEVEEHVVSSRFSTLGGTGRISETSNGRAARQQARELILRLT